MLPEEFLKVKQLYNNVYIFFDLLAEGWKGKSVFYKVLPHIVLKYFIIFFAKGIFWPRPPAVESPKNLFRFQGFGGRGVCWPT